MPLIQRYGIRAASADLKITGNNIANASTSGLNARVLNLAMFMPSVF